MAGIHGSLRLQVTKECWHPNGVCNCKLHRNAKTKGHPAMHFHHVCSMGAAAPAYVGSSPLSSQMVLTTLVGLRTCPTAAHSRHQTSLKMPNDAQ